MYKVLEKISLINCFDIYDDTLWIMGCNSKKDTVLQKYNMINMKLIQEIVLDEVERIESFVGLKYFRLVATDRYVIFIPANASNIVVYDIQKDFITKILVYKNTYSDLIREKGLFFDLQQDDENIYLFPHIYSEVIILNKKNLKIKRKRIVIEGNVESIAKENAILENDNFEEDINIKITDVLKSIVKRLDDKAIQNKSNLGKEIYYRLRKG